jgi:hypothetical protein
MEGAVYVLCAVTALACGFLLLRGYWRSRVRLLLWCGVFFLGLTVENAILFVDMILMPQVDLAVVRNSVTLVAVMLLLYGLTWEK